MPAAKKPVKKVEKKPAKKSTKFEKAPKGYTWQNIRTLVKDEKAEDAKKKKDKDA